MIYSLADMLLLKTWICEGDEEENTLQTIVLAKE